MKHLNQYVHLPRSAGKSFIQKQKSQFECEKEKTNFGKNIFSSSYTLDDLLMLPVSYVKDNVTSKSTLLINTNNCDFSKVTDNFTVNYICTYCRKKQSLFDTNILQYLLTTKEKTGIIQANCSYCYKKTKLSTHNVFKKTLHMYTQLPLESLPKNIDEMSKLLLEHIEFQKTLIDTPTRGIESYDDGIGDAVVYGTARNQYNIPTT